MGGAEKKLARATPLWTAGLEGEVVVVAAESSVPPPSKVSAVEPPPLVLSLSSSVPSSAEESSVSYSESAMMKATSGFGLFFLHFYYYPFWGKFQAAFLIN